MTELLNNNNWNKPGPDGQYWCQPGATGFNTALTYQSSLIGDFPGSPVVKASPFYYRGAGLIPMLGRSPGGGHGNPFHYSCLENPHGQTRLAGYSPWGHKESDMTE